MNAMPHRAAFALRKAGPPTPLLVFLAGEHADAIAALWPAPHEAFFALPTARRHAAGILLARGVPDEVPVRDLKRWIACERDGVLARRIFGDAAPGLMKVLRKAGEKLWTREAYARLLALYAEPNANRALRHMEAVGPVALEPLAALPAALREAKILAATPNARAAEDLAIAYALIGRINGPKGERRAVEAWGRAKDRAALFNAAADNLRPRVFRPTEPAPDLPAPFERIRTMEALANLAIEFHNCLRDFAGDVANGRMAVYRWRGAPEAAVALTWDAAGWRLAEAEAPHNEPLEDAPLRAIAHAVLLAGGRTGPSVKALAERLRRHGYGDVIDIGSDYADRLELGDLWV